MLFDNLLFAIFIFEILILGVLLPSLDHHGFSREQLCLSVFVRALEIQPSLNLFLEAIPAAGIGNDQVWNAKAL